jgi:hypothetical protein
MTVYFLINILCNLHNFTIRMAPLKCQFHCHCKPDLDGPVLVSKMPDSWCYLGRFDLNLKQRVSVALDIFGTSLLVSSNFVGASDSNNITLPFHHFASEILIIAKAILGEHGGRNMPKWHLCWGHGACDQCISYLQDARSHLDQSWFEVMGLESRLLIATFLESILRRILGVS